MSIYLGNLSIDDIERRLGVTFPEELRDYMKKRRQHKASDILPGKWHCFDIPFAIICGDRETAEEIIKYLLPIANEFKESLQVCLYRRNEVSI